MESKILGNELNMMGPGDQVLEAYFLVAGQSLHKRRKVQGHQVSEVCVSFYPIHKLEGTFSLNLLDVELFYFETSSFQICWVIITENVEFHHKKEKEPDVFVNVWNILSVGG